MNTSYKGKMKIDKKVSDILAKNGYDSINQFAKAIGEDRNNLRKNLIGEKMPNIRKALIFGKALNMSLSETMWFFYEDFMKEFYE